MGHYRQWLHYRGIDQLLRSQLAVTEHEMKQLQVQVEMLGKQFFSTENTIFLALIKEQHSQLELQIVQKHAPAETVEEQESTVLPVKALEETTSIISPALLAWGQLPNFDTQVIQKPEVIDSIHKQELPPSHSEQSPLPIDRSISVEAHNSPNPQIKIPWWLHNIDPSKQELLAIHPIDQQSTHIDYVVQRWFERWGKSGVDTKKSQEDQIE